VPATDAGDLNELGMCLAQVPNLQSVTLGFEELRSVYCAGWQAKVLWSTGWPSDEFIVGEFDCGAADFGGARAIVAVQRAGAIAVTFDGVLYHSWCASAGKKAYH
jgi:hypothetical protein